MIKKAVARRYARALFEIVRDEPSDQGLEQSLGILKETAETFKTQVSFRHLMLSPQFNRESKVRVFQSLLKQSQAGATVTKFLILLVKRNRFRLIEEVVEAFSALVAEFRQVLTVPVLTAKSPTEADQSSMKQRIEALLNRTVELQWTVDASLLGGAVVRIGETVVDGSVRGQLAAMRKKLVEA